MRFRSLTAALATLALGLGVMSGAQALDEDPGSTPTDAQTAETDVDTLAEDALDDAEALLDDDPATEPETETDATLALRDLRLNRGNLSARQRASADRLLARPAGNRVKCGTFTCVHWTTTGGHAATNAFANNVLKTMERVHRTYVRAGYRAPLKDNGRGGNTKRDIYLRDLGAGFYGYCTTDQKNIRRTWRVWAFCALDNDYAPSQFGTRNTPLENMRVTAAHEYFHAVQFGYDYGEDGWFMESTAAWAEDELYDGINDNRQYLTTGQSRRPRNSLDRYAFASYGQWIFFRYLTERLAKSTGGIPVLVRDMWRSAAYTDAQDRYSLQAIRKVLADRNRNLGNTYSAFAEANRRPGRAYDEGATYPRPSAFANATLAAGSRASGWKSVRLDHLTSSTAVFHRGVGTGSTLRVQADLGPLVRGSKALVTVHRTTGSSKIKRIRLNNEGNGQRVVGFGPGVSRVEVTLVNASTRTTCGPPNRKGGGTFSCAGKPTDQDVRERVRATFLS